MTKPNSMLPLECFAHWVERRGDQDYLVQPMPDGEVIHLTWREVDEQARRFASFLQAQNLPPNSQIALMSANCAWWIVADLGIWMAGHISVPLYPDLAPDTVQFILEHSDSQLVVVGKLAKWHDMKPGVPSDLPTIALPIHPDDSFDRNWDTIMAAHEPLANPVPRQLDELATMIYTSGSTGRPKGVMLSFKALQATAQASKDIVVIGEEDRAISYLPLAHVYERSNIEQLSLFSGMTIYFADSLATFQKDLQRARPTLFMSIPRLWVKFQAGVNQKIPPVRQRLLFKIPIVSGKVKRKILETLGLDEVRIALTASAPLSGDITKWYRDLGLELLEAYGMSENFGLSHNHRPGDAVLGTVGVPAPGVEHRIAENGEIQVRSPANMLGYYKDPDKTREDLSEDGWLHTGDMGVIEANNHLRITGRIKELFKTSKGKYVAPVPIENKLVNHPGVEAVCVAGANREQPHALVLVDADELSKMADAAARDAYAAELEAAVKAVNATLDHHEQLGFAVIVKDVWSIDNGYLTPTMKIKRNIVEEAYAGKLDAWYNAGKAVIWE